MPSTFQVIGITGRVKNPGVIETLKAVIQYLSHLNKKILVEAETAAALEDDSLLTVSREQIGEVCELLIVVGGDGSLLQAARMVVQYEVPILGINRGRLGFLTDIHPTQLDKIHAILKGEYTLEKRFLLTASVTHQEKILGKHDALNEVALIPDSIPHMNEFEIYINEQFVCSQDSDGVIIATPTGSTAYALSGGGPILHPQLDAIVIVPMFPHTLSIRPIVIEGNHIIKIIIACENSATPRLTCDGQSFIETPPGSEIIIQKKDKHLNLVHPLDYDYFETLRSKLHWGHKLHQTS